MTQGIGNDIIEIQRIHATIQRYGKRFLDRLFTPAEQAYCLQYQNSAARFAARFAAKEAVAKALGSGIGLKLSWLDIEIGNDASGKPTATLSPQTQKLFNFPTLHLSLSHCHAYATAVAIRS